jgi:hypothetical protein
MSDMKSHEFDPFGFGAFIGAEGLTAWKAVHQELLDFVSKRTQACAKVSTELTRCRSPQELWQEQMRFVKDMVSDCQTSADRLFVALNQLHANGTGPSLPSPTSPPKFAQ